MSELSVRIYATAKYFGAVFLFLPLHLIQASLLILPPRIEGTPEILFLNQDDSSRQVHGLLTLYIERNKNYKLTSAKASGDPVLAPLKIRYTLKDIRNSCNAENSSYAAAVSFFFSPVYLEMEGKVFDCSNFSVTSEKKITAKLPPDHSGRPGAFLKIFNTFAAALFTQFENRRIPPPPPQEVSQPLPKGFLVMDTSSGSFREIQYLKNYFAGENPESSSKLQAGFLSLSPGGNNLYIKSGSPAQKIQKYFSGITVQGKFSGNFPLSNALEKILHADEFRDSRITFLTSSPVAKYQQDSVLSLILQLRNKNIRLDIIATSALNRDDTRFYQKAASYGRGNCTSILYSRKIAKSDGDVTYLFLHQNSAFFSNLPLKSIMLNWPQSLQLLKSLPLPVNSGLTFDEIQNFFIKYEKTNILKAYPDESSFPYFFKSIISPSGPKRGDFLAAGQRYLVHDGQNSFWISCQKPQICQLLNSGLQKGFFYLGFSISENVDSPSGFQINPASLSIWKQDYPPPEIIITRYSRLLRYKNYHLAHGFGNENLWYCKIKVLSGKGSESGYIFQD